MNNKKKCSMKEFIKIIRTKNTVYYIDLLHENDSIKVKEFEACNENIEGHKKSMTTKDLSSNVNDLTNRVNTLTITVSDLTNIVKDLAINVSNLVVRVDNLTTRVDNLTTRVDDLTTYVKEGFMQVNLRLDTLEKDVAKIKQCPTIKNEIKLL